MNLILYCFYNVNVRKVFLLLILVIDISLVSAVYSVAILISNY